MKLPGDLTSAQEKQLETIQASARHLLSLINDLLDLAKIESGQVDLAQEPVVCQDILAGIIESLDPIASAKGLRLQAHMPKRPLEILTDKRAFSQIVINLANNAIKFTETGGIDLTLARRSARDGAGIEVAVVDTGIGIRPEDQVKLFEAFQQIERRTGERPEGTGLGLHLSKKLAGLLGGEIDFSSIYGEGSTFRLALPLESGKAA